MEKAYSQHGLAKGELQALCPYMKETKSQQQEQMLRACGDKCQRESKQVSSRSSTGPVYESNSNKQTNTQIAV